MLGEACGWDRFVYWARPIYMLGEAHGWDPFICWVRHVGGTCLYDWVGPVWICGILGEQTKLCAYSFVSKYFEGTFGSKGKNSI